MQHPWDNSTIFYQQVQEKIADLEKSMKISLYERTAFMVQFEVR